MIGDPSSLLSSNKGALGPNTFWWSAKPAPLRHPGKICRSLAVLFKGGGTNTQTFRLYTIDSYADLQKQLKRPRMFLCLWCHAKDIHNLTTLLPLFQSLSEMHGVPQTIDETSKLSFIQRRSLQKNNCVKRYVETDSDLYPLRNIDRNQDLTCDMPCQPSAALKYLPRKRPQDVHVCGFQQSVATCSHRSSFQPQDGRNTLPSLPPVTISLPTIWRCLCGDIKCNLVTNGWSLDLWRADAVYTKHEQNLASM